MVEQIPPLVELYTCSFILGRFKFITDGKHLKQEQALKYLTDGKTREVGYGGAAGGAKSWTGCAWMLFMCLAYPETKYFIAREELKRIKDSTLVSFFKVCKMYGVKLNIDYKYNGQDHTIIFKNGSRIDLLEVAFKPSDPLFERYGSSEYTCGWFEEVGEMHFLAYDTLKSRCGRQYNDKYGIVPTTFATFNPKKNFVYTYFYRRDKDGTLPEHIVFIKALLYDNPFREQEYEQQLLNMSSKAQKERLLYGNFEYDDDPSVLCEYDAICDIFTNDHVRPIGRKRISADLAMKGRDKFVAGVAEGNVITVAIVQDKSTGKSIETDLKRLMIDNSVPHSGTIVDSDGMGNYLESYLTGIKEFHGNGKAVNPEFVNIKTECAYKLAEKINKGELKVICTAEQQQRIIEEISALKADDIDNDEGKKRIIGKDTMKELIGRSPDFLDMLIMMQWFDVKKSNIFVT
jgi:phage terminase large subunit